MAGLGRRAFRAGTGATLRLSAGLHTLEVVVDGDLCVATVDGQVALSTRIYDLPTGRIGVFAGEGSVTVTDFEVRRRTNN